MYSNSVAQAVKAFPDGSLEQIKLLQTLAISYPWEEANYQGIRVIKMTFPDNTSTLFEYGGWRVWVW